jgi:quinol monooxygenase YgiN
LREVGDVIRVRESLFRWLLVPFLFGFEMTRTREVAIMIRVIIERHCRLEKNEELERLLVQLRSRAMLHRGYVSGETLRSISDPSKWVVISTWVDATTWKVWESSPERQEFAKKIAPLLTAPAELSIYDFVSTGLTTEPTL